MGLLCGLNFFGSSLPATAWNSVVTIGDGTLDRHGWLYSPPSAGFGESTDVGMELSGETMAGVYSLGSADFSVSWEGVLAQDDFTSVVLIDRDGILRTYNTADADFGVFGDFTIWTWNSGGDQAWRHADVGLKRAVGIVL